MQQCPKDKACFSENAVRTKRLPDYAYNKWLNNRDAPCEEWIFRSLLEAYEEHPPSRSRRPDSLFEYFNRFIVENAERVCRLASISDTGAGQTVIEGKAESLNRPGEIVKVERNGDLDDVYILDGQQVIFYDKNVTEIEGQLEATAPLTNIWTDIAWEGIAKEGGVTFKKGKKPERLVHRCLSLATSPGDLVIDSFAGSGTTGAVAHKMGRRWIMVELGEHCHTHIIPRMKKVIDGEDQGGISKAVNWQGGGGFRYYKLGPTLIVEDEWGNPVINPEFNAGMLAEAMCKLEGFTFDPNAEVYWQQGRSSETDFIYVTTQFMSRDMLARISDEVGPNRSLLICCSAFRCDVGQFENLTVKKIPKAVLNKCEWGHDDYSLEIENLPEALPTPEEDSRGGAETRSDGKKGSRKFGKAKRDGQLDLFDLAQKKREPS